MKKPLDLIILITTITNYSKIKYYTRVIKAKDVKIINLLYCITFFWLRNKYE